jgi:hypothetical protein
MTLLEVLVSLAILALVVGISLSLIGPWLKHGRRLEEEARFWKDRQSAEQVVSDLAVGATDLDDNLQLGPDRASFLTFDPHVSPKPASVTLQVQNDSAGGELRLHEAAGRDTVLLAGAPRLRLIAGAPATGQPPRRLVVEAEIGRDWTPIIVAPFVVNGPSACSFDIISQACR